VDNTDPSWERRLSILWGELDRHEPQIFVQQIELLVRELPPSSAIASFERASAQDSKRRFRFIAPPLNRV